MVKQFGIVRTGSQRLRVLLMDGSFSGQEIDADNLLLGKMDSDKMFRPGDQVLVILSTNDNKIVAATAYDHYRLGTELMLILVFAGMLIVVTGWIGLKTCLSIFFAVVVIWRILLPGVLSGLDPIVLAFWVVMAISGVTLFSVAGLTKTALVAWLGSFLGILLTTISGLVALPGFPIAWRHSTIFGNVALFGLCRFKPGPSLYRRHLFGGLGSCHRSGHRCLGSHERSCP